MTSGLSVSFDLYRTNLGLALRVFSFGEECRRGACAFESHRIDRDLEAFGETQQAAAGAKDWDEFNAACQPMLRNYFATTNHIWQEALGAAVRSQIAFRNDMLEALTNWQSNWSTQYQKQADVSAADTPMHEWMHRFEQALAGAMDGAAIWGGERRAATPEAAAGATQAIQGEKHVG